MMDDEGEFWTTDRVQKIQQIIGEYGEDNFYMSFSGGKDSTALSVLLDEALPGNRIPRVFANTGIEYGLIVRFVKRKAAEDSRIVIINAGVNIPEMLERVGYPFKSKEHAEKVNSYQMSGMKPWIEKYVHPKSNTRFCCPQQLRYQFTDAFGLKISKKCCNELKKKPLHRYQRETHNGWAITAITRAEGGSRAVVKGCVVAAGKKFHPLLPMDGEWIDWYIKARGIELCDLYSPPYKLLRTGCVGCPFIPHLQRELDTLTEVLPAERKKAERIWKPVYDEYRRIGYRLRQQLSIEDLQFLTD